MAAGSGIGERDPREIRHSIRWVDEHQAQITTDATAAMERQLDWFCDLDAEERSWITVIVQQGIAGFRSWVADPLAFEGSSPSLFAAAPQALTRSISLRHTVELVRLTIRVVEDAVTALPESTERAALEMAVVQYAREVAFAAADVYARAAETRGNWDARIEAMVVDAVVRAETDETLLSRASALGWSSDDGEGGHPVCVAIGEAATQPGAVDHLRHRAEQLGLSVLAATQGPHLVVILGGAPVADQESAVRAVTELEDCFAPSRIVVGPPVDGLSRAYVSARDANSGLRAAVAWPEGPKTAAAAQLLPERALNGDGHARRELANTIYQGLAEAGGDLMDTCATFLNQGGSVEATARALFVHPNTVRYRLKRIQEVTGYAPSDARDSYVLKLAITLGRLLG